MGYHSSSARQSPSKAATIRSYGYFGRCYNNGGLMDFCCCITNSGYEGEDKFVDVGIVVVLVSSQKGVVKEYVC